MQFTIMGKLRKCSFENIFCNGLGGALCAALMSLANHLAVSVMDYFWLFLEMVTGIFYSKTILWPVLKNCRPL